MHIFKELEQHKYYTDMVFSLASVSAFRVSTKNKIEGRMYVNNSSSQVQRHATTNKEKLIFL